MRQIRNKKLMFMILQLCHQRKLHNIKLLCVKKNTTRAAVLASDNSKVSAIIMPSFQPKNSVISKEQQLLEDLKKKEQKADQIHKRILAERQQKAEQNKKNREEKMKKQPKNGCSWKN